MTDPRYARLRAGDVRSHAGAAAVPDDGMCLSVYLVVRPADRDDAVLLGRLDRHFDWATLGGIDPGRLDQIGERWMLPSRQLRFFEGPDEAADRIAVEQLGGRIPGLTGPRVFSEAYRRPGAATDPHWDLHFVYEGRWPADRPLAAPGFAPIAFVPTRGLDRTRVARGQADVLALAGCSGIATE